MKAITDWYAVHRPDLLPQIEQLLKNESMVAVMGAGFEAGRCFQYSNPECPLGAIDGDWKSINVATRASRETEVKAKICSCGGSSA